MSQLKDKDLSEELATWFERFRKLRLTRGARHQQEYDLLRETLVSDLTAIISTQNVSAAMAACGRSLMELGEFQLAKEHCFEVHDKAIVTDKGMLLLHRAECDLQMYLKAADVKGEEFARPLLASIEQLLQYMTHFMSSLDDSEADNNYWMVANVCILTQRALRSLLEASYGYMAFKHAATAVFLLESTLVLTTVKYLGLRVRLYACAVSCFEALDNEEGFNCALQLSQRLLEQVNRLEQYEMQDLPVPQTTLQIIQKSKRAALIRIFKQKARLLGEGKELNALAEEMLGLVKTEEGIELTRKESSQSCINRGRHVASCLREYLSDRLPMLSLRTDVTRQDCAHLDFILEAVKCVASLELGSCTEWPDKISLEFLDDVLFFLKQAFVSDRKQPFLELLRIAQTLQTSLQVRKWECQLFTLLQPLKFPDEEVNHLPKGELSDVDGRQVPIRSIEEIALFLYECMKSASEGELGIRKELLVGTALYLWSPFCIAMFETVGGFEGAQTVPSTLLQLTLQSLTAVQWVLEYFNCEDVVLRSRVCITLATLTGFVQGNFKSAIQSVRRNLAALEQARGASPIQEKTIADLEVDLCILLFTFELDSSREDLFNVEKLLHKEFKYNRPARAILSACYARTQSNPKDKLYALATSLRSMEETKQAIQADSLVVDESCAMNVVGSSTDTITLRVSTSGEEVQVEWFFKVYGKLFSNTEVSTSNSDLLGTGIICSVPAGTKYKDVVIRGLKPNASYRFAVGVCNKGGLPIGKLGPSSGPVFTVNGLPLFRCYAFIRFCIYEAIPLLNKSEKREALKLFEEARTSERSDMSISGCEKEIILWRDNPMDLLQLELRWDNTSSRVAAQAFIHSLFVEQEVRLQYHRDIECTVRTKLQIQGLQSVQKMLAAAQLALLLKDNSLALQACTMGYNYMLPCLSSIRADHRLTGALVTIHKVLGRVPRSCWEESTFAVYCRVSFALYRLCLNGAELETLARSVLEDEFLEIIRNNPELRDLKAVVALDTLLNHVLPHEEESEAEATELISEESVYRLIASGERESLDEAWRLISVCGSEHHERYLPLAYLTFIIALHAKHELLPKWIAEFHESLWDIHHTAESSLKEGVKDVLMEEEFRELPYSCSRARTYPFYVKASQGEETEEEVQSETKCEDVGDNEASVAGDSAHSQGEENGVDQRSDAFRFSGKRLYESQLTLKEREQLCMLGSLQLCLAMALDEKVTPSLAPVASANPGRGPYSSIEFKLEELEKANSPETSAVPPLNLTSRNFPESGELKASTADEETCEGLEPRKSIGEESEVDVMQVIRAYTKSIHRSRWAEAVQLACVTGRRLWNFILRVRLSPHDFKDRSTDFDWRYLWVVADCLLDTSLNKQTEVWREKLVVFSIKVFCVLGLKCEAFAMGKRFLELFGKEPASSSNTAVVRKLATHVCNAFIHELASQVSQAEVVRDGIQSSLDELVQRKQGRRSRKYNRKSPDEVQLEESLEIKEEEIRALNERTGALQAATERLRNEGVACSQARQNLETARRLARQASLADVEPGSSWISRALDEIKSTARSKGSSRTFAGLSARSGISSASHSPRSRQGHSTKKGTSRRMEVDGNTRLWRRTVSAYTKTISIARERQETIVLAAAYSELGDVYVASDVADVRSKAVSAWKSCVDSILQDTNCSVKWREILGSAVANHPSAGISKDCTITSPELIGQSCLKAYGLDGCILVANCATKVAISLESSAAKEAIEYLRLSVVMYSSMCSYGLPHPTRKCEYVDYACMDLPKAFDVALNRHPVIEISETVSSMLTAITTLASLGNHLDLLSVMPVLRCAQLVVDTYVKDDMLSRSVRHVTADVLIALGYLKGALDIINNELSTSFTYDDTIDADHESNRDCLEQLVYFQSSSNTEEGERDSSQGVSKELHGYLSRIVCTFILRATELARFQDKQSLLEKLDFSGENNIDDPSWRTLQMRVWLSTRNYDKLLDNAGSNGIIQLPSEHCSRSALIELLEWTKQRCLLSEALLCLRRLDDCVELCGCTLAQVGFFLDGGILYDLIETKANALLMVGKGADAYQVVLNVTKAVEVWEDNRLARLLLKYCSLSLTYAYSNETKPELEQARVALHREMENFGVEGEYARTEEAPVYLRCWPVFIQLSLQLHEDKRQLERAAELTAERLPFCERENSHLLYSLAILQMVSAPSVSAIQALVASLKSSMAWGNEYSLVLKCLEALYLLFAFHELPQVSRGFAQAASYYCLCAGMAVRRKQSGVGRAEEVAECARVADLSGLILPNSFDENTTYKDVIVRCFQANQEYLLTFHPALKEESSHLHLYLKEHLDYYRESCCIELGTLPDIDDEVQGTLNGNDKAKTDSAIIQWMRNTPADDTHMLLCVHLAHVDSSGEMKHDNHRFVVSTEGLTCIEQSLKSTEGDLERENQVRGVLGLDAVDNSTIDMFKLEESLRVGEGGCFSEDADVFAWWKAACQR